jgi:hypothetical protein
LKHKPHFFTCDEISTTWITQLTNTINDEFPRDSHSPLRNILIWALTPCRTNSGPFSVQDNTPQFAFLVQEQTDIGWNQVLKGQWSTEWVRLLDVKFPSKGEQLATSLLHGIWTTTLKIWNERCKQQHRHHENNTTHQRQALMQQVLVIYNQKPNLDIVDQLPLMQPIDTIQAMPIQLLQRWIKCTETFTKQGLHRACTRTKRNNQAITNFFHPTRHRHTSQSRNEPILGYPPPQNHEYPLGPNARENLWPP